MARGRDGSLPMRPGTGAGGFGAARIVGWGWNIFLVILP